MLRRNRSHPVVAEPVTVFPEGVQKTINLIRAWGRGDENHLVGTLLLHDVQSLYGQEAVRVVTKVWNEACAARWEADRAAGIIDHRRRKPDFSKARP